MDWNTSTDWGSMFGGASDMSSGMSDLGFNMDEVDWSGLGDFSFADGGLVGKSAMKQHFAKSIPRKLADGGLVDNAEPLKKQNNMLASQTNTILDPRAGASKGGLGFNEANMGQGVQATSNPISKNPIIQAASGGVPSNQASGARVGLTREQINEIIEARSAESSALGKEGNDSTAAQGNISNDPSATATTTAMSMALGMLGIANPALGVVANLGKMALSVPSVQQFMLDMMGVTPSTNSVAQSSPVDAPTAETSTLEAMSDPVGTVTVGPVTQQDMDQQQQDEQDALNNPVTDTTTNSGDAASDGGTGTNGSAGDGNAGDGGTGAAGDGSGSGGGTASAADGGLIASLMSEAPTAGIVQGAGSSIGDKVDAKLSPDEYVLPADVVEALGVDKLDAIVKRYHTPAVVQKAQMRGRK